MNRKKLHLLLILAVVLVSTLPFLNKAAHVDDIYVLYGKNNILKHPLNPYDFQMDFISGKFQFSIYADPPFLLYYLAFASIILGNSLILLHLSMLVFPLIAAYSMYYLAEKFTKNNFYASLMAVAAPVFMVMSHNFMQDAPAMGMLLLSIALFVHGIDKNNNKLIFLANVSAGIAYLTKYNGLLFLPLFIIYAILKKKPKKLFYLAIPLAFIIGWSVFSYGMYGHIHMFSTLSAWSDTNKGAGYGLIGFLILIATQLITELSSLGGAVIFPLFLIFPFIKKKSGLIAYIISLALPLPAMFFLYRISSTFMSGQYTFAQLALLNFFISAALFFLYNAMLDFFRVWNLKYSNIFKNPGKIFIYSWLFMTFIAGFTLVGGSVRYDTLMIPPMILSFFVLTDNRGLASRRKLRSYYASAFILTILLGFSLSAADYIYASTYRDFANGASRYNSSSNQLWFLGHGGFAYYMLEKGYLMLPAGSNVPKKGDVIIKASIPSPRKIGTELKERIFLLRTEAAESSFPVRIHNPDAHAGFYTYGAGFLPYSFSTSSIEHFSIYLVEK